MGMMITISMRILVCFALPWLIGATCNPANDKTCPGEFDALAFLQAKIQTSSMKVDSQEGFGNTMGSPVGSDSQELGSENVVESMSEDEENGEYDKDDGLASLVEADEDDGEYDEDEK